MVNLPSLSSFIYNFSSKLKDALRVKGMRYKILFVFYSFLSSFPRTIRRRYKYYDEIIGKLINRPFRNRIVDFYGIKYCLVDINSFFIVSPRHEYWIWEYFKPKKGDVVIDVGAHIGKYTFLSSKKVGEEGFVIALEPHPYNYGALIRGIKINRLKNVKALNLAAWNKEEELRLYLSLKADEHSLKLKKSPTYIKVQAYPLDKILKSLSLRRVDWIKIYAEGSEVEALEGLKETLIKYKPKVIVEVIKDNRERVEEIMRKQGYDGETIISSKSLSYLLYRAT
ncbi:MAG: FkbM family methyltransferase [Nitrososphaerales archaeon]